jgi:integrase
MEEFDWPVRVRLRLFRMTAPLIERSRHGRTSKRQQPDVPWNKGKLIGQKAPLKLKEIWAIRIRLQLGHRARDLALFNLGIDSKLRGCDLVGLRVCDVAQGGRIASRAIVMQRKTHRPVQFELTDQTREAVQAWYEGPPRLLRFWRGSSSLRPLSAPQPVRLRPRRHNHRRPRARSSSRR